MGYIMDLRKVVGHRPLIMTCAGVLIINEWTVGISGWFARTWRQF